MAIKDSILREINFKRFPVADNPILPKKSTSCPECGQLLVDTGWMKPLSEPLLIYQCMKCCVEYWIESEI
jgi:hypothetical protein